VFQINLPPLRARGDDVLLLAERFIAQIAARYAKPAPVLDEAAIRALRQHSWPGNVRELRNVIERAVLLGNAPQLGAADLGLMPGRPMPAMLMESEVLALESGVVFQAGTSLEAVERQHLVAALQQAGWNVTKAARALQISRDTLRYRIEKHGLRASG
jgi:two-component system, NtrC family, response regulator AtoC